MDLDTRAPPPLAGGAPLCTATHLRRDLPLTTPVPGLAAHDVGAGTCHICAGTGRCVALRTSSTRAFTFGPRGGALLWASEAFAPGMRWSPNGPDGSWTIRYDAATVFMPWLSIYVACTRRSVATQSASKASDSRLCMALVLASVFAPPPIGSVLPMKKTFSRAPFIHPFSPFRFKSRTAHLYTSARSRDSQFR